MNKKNLLFVVLAVVLGVLFFTAKNFDKIKQKFLLPIDFPTYKVEGKTIKSKKTFDEKFWLHRVNNIERLKLVENKYRGIEFDIIFDTELNCFYIAHDPNPQAYIYLDDYFSELTNIDERCFWLDFKNLDEGNTIAAFDELISLTNKYGIAPTNMIVESENSVFLSIFTDFGFNTSYYLPTINPYKASKAQLLEYIEKIDDTLKKSRVNFLSANYIVYQLMKFYYPESDINLWLWDGKNKNLPPWNKILNDNKVNIVLCEKTDSYL